MKRQLWRLQDLRDGSSLGFYHRTLHSLPEKTSVDTRITRIG